MSAERDPKVDSTYKELEGAMCVWARAKGLQPAAQYFHEVTPSVRKLVLEGTTYWVSLTVADETDVSAGG